MKKLMTGVLLASCSLVAASGCRSTDAPDTASEPAQDLVLTDGERISGTMTARSLEIPQGATVYVEDDLDVHATGHVYIDGKLLAVDREPDDERSEGPRIEIETTGALLITGEIVGSQGQDYDHLPLPEGAGKQGGKGSSIIIRAERYSMMGVIRAGKGGNAGFGGQGGTGGDIYLVGRTVNSSDIRSGVVPHPERGFTGGDGGRAGKADRSMNSGKGGDGGAGGSVFIEESETRSE